MHHPTTPFEPTFLLLCIAGFLACTIIGGIIWTFYYRWIHRQKKSAPQDKFTTR